MKKILAIICVALSFMMFTPSVVKAEEPHWVSDENGWWYANGDGTFPRSQWKQLNGYWYYFGDDGYMLTGWQRIDGKWYYFDLNQSEARIGKWVEDAYNADSAINGIDVSSWQGNIDWATVRNTGIQFAMIRLGFNNAGLDPYFAKNITSAHSVGIQTGVYYYSTATTLNQAVLDAQFVIDNLQGYYISYPVAIDLEDKCQQGLSKQELTNIAKAFCNEIAKAGYTPMVYCNESWYRNKIDFSQLPGVERWIAGWMSYPSSDIPRGIWQSGSTLRLAGIGGRVDSDFGFVNYNNIVTPRTSVSSSYIRTKGFWQKDANGWWFQYLNGSFPKSTWESIDGYWYYFNWQGYISYGWLSYNSNWYFFNSEGKMHTGWAQINGAWYYFRSNGTLATGWQQIGGNWYYFNGNGSMLTGWQQYNGSWYYLRGNGTMVVGWAEINGSWFYFNAGGILQTGWQQIGGSWYYFNWNGNMQTGWIPYNGSWYYLKGNGAMSTGWTNDGKGWYYFNGAGIMLTGWQQIDGTWFYFNGNGTLLTGWTLYNGSWYYLKENGAMSIGWTNDGKGWYYFNGAGIMVTGWQYINGVWYYFNANGTMLSNTYVDGFWLNENGACIL